ncbi:MAG: Flp pilus assembly complex ATPase component TadA [Candidatus Aenigmarchaeota archaeon]|nr:Flp pilus assembly complex ATPase component TadA [Candidatus Aenigmarchaeota archaeon]
MLLEKYKPVRIEEMVNKAAAMELKDLLRVKKPFIITGPAGSGKTLALNILAKEMNYEIIHLVDDMLKTPEIAKQRSIFYKGKIFIIELDSLRTLERLDDFAKQSAFPIVLSANDIYQKRYFELRKKHKLVKFRKVSDIYLMNIVKKICLRESIPCSDMALGNLVSLYNGDIRAVLIALECLRAEGITPSSIKNLEECKFLNVFDVLLEVYNGELRHAIRLLSNMDQDIEPWIEENIIDGKSIAANELLAKADLFKTRIERTGSWSLQKYYFDMLGAISALNTGKKMFNPPYSKWPRRQIKTTLNNKE